MRIPAEDYLRIVRNAPVVSVDLLPRDPEGRVLLGWRNNEPARGSWFVPGSRVLKGERLAETIARVARDELGLEVDPSAARLLGPFQHFYDTNFAGAPDVPTHFVVLAYEIGVERPAVAPADDQHAELRWWSPRELLDSPDVHPYTKDYFRASPA